MNITRTSQLISLVAASTVVMLGISGCTTTPEPQPATTSENRSAAIGSNLILMCIRSASPRTVVWDSKLTYANGEPVSTDPIDLQYGYQCAMNTPETLFGDTTQVNFTIDGKPYKFWRITNNIITYTGFPVSDLRNMNRTIDSTKISYYTDRLYEDARVEQSRDTNVNNGHTTETVTIDFK